MTAFASKSLACAALFITLSNATALDHRFGVQGGVLVNIEVDFSGLGVTDPATDIGEVSVAGDDRTYDDGFVRNDDIVGNEGINTTYWSYQNSSQLDGNGNIVYSSSSGGATREADADDDPQGVVELFYELALPQNEAGLQFGLKLAGGLGQLDFSSSSTLSGNVTVVTDTYSLNPDPNSAVIMPDNLVPAAPYTGPQSGPGFMISDVPTRATSTTSGGSTISGTREIEGDLLYIAVGPFARFNPTNRLSIGVSAGLAFYNVDSDFSYTESVDIAGTVVTSSGSISDSETITGGYLQASASYLFTEAFGINLSGQVLFADEVTQEVSGRRAVMDLGSGLMVTAGVFVAF